MRIYILRHAIAEEAGPGASDADRAMTPEGRQKLLQVLKRARQIKVQPALILTSPYKRAVQTAEIAAEILGCKEPARTDSLLPSGSPPRIWKELRAASPQDVMLVGHEPLLSSIAAFLLHAPDLAIDLKKAALIRIDVEDPSPQPHGTLNWLLTPKLAGA